MPESGAEPTTKIRPVDLEKWSAPALGFLLLMAVPAFWPAYLSSPVELGTPTTHLHAFTATAWFLLLIAQPVLLRTGHRRAHRVAGYTSLIVAPLVLAGFVAGAHGRIDRWEPSQWEAAKFVLYLQISLAVVFGVLWGLGMVYRKDRKVHARFMVGTGLTFVDPVLARLLPALPVVPGQFVTFNLVNAVLLWLIWRERHAKRGRWAFPVVLAAFLVLEAPLALGLTGSSAWDSFARWFQALPLT